MNLQFKETRMKTHLVLPLLRGALIAVAMTTTFVACGGGRVAVWGDNSYNQTTMPNGLKNIRAIAAGRGHSLALKADGRVVTWGWNPYGLIPPADLQNVTAVAAGDFVSMALRANGTVVVWGSNSSGQTNVPADLTRVTAIATGGAHCLALKADGTVRVWGSTSSVIYNNTNVPAGLAGVTAVAAGSYHSVALIADGSVVAWGNNSYSQTNVPAGLSNVIAISATGRHSLALKADGTVVAWGENYSGQTEVPEGLSDVVAIAAGGANLALKADGSLVSWGDDYYGLTNLPPGIANVTAIACGGGHNLALVADGPPEILIQPADSGVLYQSNLTLTATASGFAPLSWRWYFNGAPLTNSARSSGVTSSSLGIANAQFSDIGNYSVVVSNAFGAVQSTNGFVTVISPPLFTRHPVGQTGLAGTNLALSATAIGTPPLNYHWQRNGLPVPGATSNFLALANLQTSEAGTYTLLVSNAYGTNESFAAQITVLESAPYILAQPTNLTALLGGTASFNINARGSVPLTYQWRHEGVDLPGETNATLTVSSLQNADSGYYSVAIRNPFGETNSAKAFLSVREVGIWSASGNLVAAPADLTNLTAIAVGNNFLLGLKSDGQVRSWAQARTIYTPTNIPPDLSGVKAIAAGLSHGLALRSNGTVVAWGNQRSIITLPPPYPTPYQPDTTVTNIPAGLSNVIAIAAGDYHSLALTADGRVVSWGYYQPKSLWYPPYPTSYATNVPTTLSNVVAIAAGGGQSLAVKADGRVVAWGTMTNVPANLSNVITVACTDDYCLALRTDGTVAAWAAPIIFSPIPRISPMYVNTNIPPGLSNVVALAAGNIAIALKSDGSVSTWSTNVGPWIAVGSPTPNLAGLSNVFAISTKATLIAALTGDGSPRFTLQPASQTTTNGATIRFSARAVGIPSLTFQWQLDGAALNAQTNADLILPNVHGANAGIYQLVASNPLGAVTSAPARLAIPFSTNLPAALNATNLLWATAPTTAPWFAQNRVTHDGLVAAQSGRIGANQQSTLHATVTGPGTVTFWWKVSSEEEYDRLWFTMDSLNWATWISGEEDWQQFTYPVPAGTHTLRWAYTKDGTVSAGQDAGWLDQVLFTPTAPLQLTAPLRTPDGSFAFSSGMNGRLLSPEQLARIEIHASTNLRDWVVVPGLCTLTNGALHICDPHSTNFPQRFYRVVER